MTDKSLFHPLDLVELRMTCSACPSQWEGRLADGRYIYARYRWGHLTVGSGATIGDAVNSYSDLYEGEHGDGLDGVMGTDSMLLHAGLTYRGSDDG
jgi:hypothetical protein